MSKQEPQFIPRDKKKIITNVCYIKLINKSIRDFLVETKQQKKKNLLEKSINYRKT